MLAQESKDGFQYLSTDPAPGSPLKRNADCDASFLASVLGDFLWRQMRGRCQFTEPCKEAIQDLPSLNLDNRSRSDL